MAQDSTQATGILSPPRVSHDPQPTVIHAQLWSQVPSFSLCHRHRELEDGMCLVNARATQRQTTFEAACVERGFRFYGRQIRRTACRSVTCGQKSMNRRLRSGLVYPASHTAGRKRGRSNASSAVEPARPAWRDASPGDETIARFSLQAIFDFFAGCVGRAPSESR